jgi:hypothetical protein
VAQPIQLMFIINYCAAIIVLTAKAERFPLNAAILVILKVLIQLPALLIHNNLLYIL